MSKTEERALTILKHLKVTVRFQGRNMPEPLAVFLPVKHCQIHVVTTTRRGQILD